MTDLHIRGLDDPDVRLDGMPATQRLWASEDPYDLEGTEETFLEAVRENLRHHQACPFYADWLERNGFSPDDLRTMDDIVRIPPVPPVRRTSCRARSSGRRNPPHPSHPAGRTPSCGHP